MSNGLRVSEIAVVDPPTVYRLAIVAFAFSAVLTLAAHTDAVSPLIIGTLMVNGDPAIPDPVTVTLTLPLALAVVDAVAVSTCAVPTVGDVLPDVDSVSVFQ